MTRASHDTLSRIEDAGLNASAPPQQRWIDGWWVRFSPGSARRARCIHALAEGILPLDGRLALCRDLYRERGLPMVFRSTPFSRPCGLDAELERRGWRREGDSHVMVSDMLRTPAEMMPTDCRIDEIDTEAYAHIIGAVRGSSPQQVAAHAERLRSSPVLWSARVAVGASGRTLAGALMAVEGERVGLYDVFTAASERNRGLARAVCGRLPADAAALGARVAYLQVDAGNDPARALYRRLGFVDAYRYHYRTPPEAAARGRGGAGGSGTGRG